MPPLPLQIKPIDTVYFVTSYLQQGDGQDEAAKKAYEALMTFHIYQPTTDEYVNFKREIREMRLAQFNWTMPPGEDVSTLSLVVNLTH